MVGLSICPHCGGSLPRKDTDASLVFAAIGDGFSGIAYIKSQLPKDMTAKNVYNALAYLVRTKRVVRVRYGIYRRVEK